MKSLLTALRFLTVVPFPNAGESRGRMAAALVWFPVAGGVMGLAAAGLAAALSFILPPYLTAAAGVLCLTTLSGAVHLDGLADTADGFFSHRGKEQILAIMRDSRIGVMGAAAVFFVLTLKILALGALASGDRVAAFFLLPVFGRAAIVLAMARLPYARPGGGLGSLFYGAAKARQVLVALFFPLALAWYLSPGKVAFCALAFLLVHFFFVRLCLQQIGGATGDTLGAVCELTEAIVALALAVRV